MAVSRTLESTQYGYRRTGDREYFSVLTINLSRESGRYSPTKGLLLI
jgi:hypothetical protein